MPLMDLTAHHRRRYVDAIVSDPGLEPARMQALLQMERLLFQDAWDSLSSFVQQCWAIHHPGIRLEWAWYHDLICAELEHVTREFEAGRKARLIICVPPGCMKSFLVSVYWPSRWWLKNPDLTFLAVSSSPDLSERDSRRMREVIGSDWYQRLVIEADRRGLTPRWALDRTRSAVINFANTARGARQCFAIGGSVTGHRGDGIIVDDPHQVKDALGTPEQVAAAFERAHDKVEVAIPSRVNDLRRAFEVTIMQRVGDGDVAGRRLAEDDPCLRKVVLSAHYDPESPYNHPDDPRTEPGELLDPVRMPEKVIAAQIARLDAQVPGQGQTQYEQRPQKAEGGIFKRAWFSERYNFDFQRPPRPYDEVVVTIDATFKHTRKADFVSMQCWARHGWTKYYLAPFEVHGRMSYVELREAARDFIRWMRPTAILIEEKANGAALIDELKSEFPCVVPFVPDRFGDKVSRGQTAAVYPHAGHVLLPNPDYQLRPEECAAMVVQWLTEVCGFPAALYDDRVDAWTQLLIWWGERSRVGDHSAKSSALKSLGKKLGITL